jgi:hypothetical protein
MRGIHHDFILDWLRRRFNDVLRRLLRRVCSWNLGVKKVVLFMDD